MKKTMLNRDVIRRSALSLAIGLCFSTSVLAQSSEGSIFGRISPKTKVEITNLENGATRKISSETDGSFSVTKLQPGTYRVVVGEQTQTVIVTTGSGTEVKLGAATDTVVIKGAPRRSTIDMSSTESNHVFTAAEIQALPVARNTTAVVMLTPGTVQGSAGLGNLASIGGASVAENAYYINGMDVTNIRNFLSYAQLPYEAIAETQVKTGGYGAEYGRSLGGVVSLTTKSGTNNWHGGFSTVYNPGSFLKAKSKNIVDQELYGSDTVPSRYISFNNGANSHSITNTLYLGGPIIQDKLFFFALTKADSTDSEGFGRLSSSRSNSKSPQNLIKLDYLITADNRLEFTAFNTRGKSYTDSYVTPLAQAYAVQHIGDPSHLTYASSSDVYQAKYTGYITDNLNVSAQLGKVKELANVRTNPNQNGRDCPYVIDKNVNPAGCYDPNNNGAQRDPNAPPDGDTRTSGRLDLEYTLGNHTIRAGYDGQKFVTNSAGSVSFSNGIYYRYYVSTNGTVNGVKNVVKPGEEYVRVWKAASGSGSFNVINDAKYIEDSWKVSKDILINGGLRWESFDNQTGSGVSFVKKENLLAPRLGGAWNVFGDGDTKIFGNLGRYYIPVASNTNVRSTHFEYSNKRFYTFTGKDPRTQAPITLGPEVGLPQLSGSTIEPNAGTVADTQLKPMSQDEIILGFQKALNKEWTMGAKFSHRTVNDGMDDFCGKKGIDNYMKSIGNKTYDWTKMSSCILMNPGRDLHVNIDVADDGKLVPVTIPASFLKLAKYERTYNDLQLTLERPFDGKWAFNGSYTFSRSRGTSEGYVTSNTDQADAGITAEFDHSSYTDGIYGPSPNERTHSFKLFGAYALSDSLTLGVNASLVSGRPITCLGRVPSTVWDFYDPSGGINSGAAGDSGYGSSSSYYCLNGKFDADGVALSSVVPRGSVGHTPWTKMIDLSLNYKMKLSKGTLTLSAAIFNLFNFQQVVTVNENKDYSYDTHDEGRINKNYLLPTSYQSPRSARLTVRYDF